MAEALSTNVIEDIVSVKSSFLKNALSGIARKVIKHKLGIDIYMLDIDKLEMHTSTSSGAVSGELACKFVVGKSSITKVLENIDI